MKNNFEYLVINIEKNKSKTKIKSSKDVNTNYWNSSFSPTISKDIISKPLSLK